MAIISETGIALADPLINLWNSLVGILPGLIAAIVILIIGYLISWAVGFLVKKFLEKTAVMETLVEKASIKTWFKNVNFPAFFGFIIRWAVFVFFLPPAAELVRATSLATFLQVLALWIPNLIVAIIIALIGLIATEYLAHKIAVTTGAKTVAEVTKIVLIIMIAIVVLNQVGIQISVAENSFLIVLGGIMLGLGLALGIGFGLALKDDAKIVIRQVKKRI